MYKVCYVITDNEKFRFYNELLISLASLRRYNFSGIVYVLMDEETNQLLVENNRNELETFCAEKIIVKIPPDYAQKEKSRFIKTSIRNLIDGDFLFIDTDTIVASQFSPTISEQDLAMVQDSHCTLIEKGVVKEVSMLFEKCGYKLNPERCYFNSGVIWAKDTKEVRDFFNQWHNNWKQCREKGVIFDQPALNHLNDNLNGRISNLDDSYNIQISSTPTPIYCLHKAKIIHYYNAMSANLSPYLLQDIAIQSQGYMSEIVQKIIESPTEAFFPCKLIRCDGATEKILYSSVFNFYKNLYLHHKLIFRACNFMFSIPKRISFAFHKK